MYINSVTEENKNKYISIWLLLITFLVVLMIFIGGLTRLTDSGLSITKWDLISGILPPFTLEQWKSSFELYKQIPEYKLINSSMTLEEFKYIYWWEYIHRFLGRIVGIFYLVPLIYFTWKKILSREYLISFYMIFLLIVLQGFIGWYMVRSGLVENTDVSHFRLSLHLTVAFIILILLIWNYLKLKEKFNLLNTKKIPFFLPILLLIFLLTQISIGAFTSGLDAGLIYQTWPLMGDSYFPDDSNLNDLLSLKSLSTPSLVQFLHRNMAYFILVLFLIIMIITFKNRELYHLRKIITLLFAAILLQVFLGIITVLSGAQIILASLHQMGSILLIVLSTTLVFKNT